MEFVKQFNRRLLLLTLIAAAMGSQLAYGQTFDEWFRQKSTQKKYLLQQISALMVYRQYAQNGYAIAKGGLGSIGTYIGKEFRLHDAYYTRLKTVSEPVRNSPQVKAILRWQQDIISRTNTLKKQTWLRPEETNYINTVCAALLKDCDGQLHDLEIILSDNRTEMSDEARLRQLARLHANMQGNYRFATAFQTQVMLLAGQKEQQIKDVNQIRKLYGSDH